MAVTITADGRFDGPPVSAARAAMVLPPLNERVRMLVVSPHPDDESLAVGGLIQAVLDAGGTVDVLLLTDGDDNPWPQRFMERRIVIDAQGRTRWGTRRRGEVRAALARLGVEESSLHTLGWHDMDITGCLSRDAAAAVTTISAVITATAPTLMVLPALGDRHPDHGSAHVMARLAARAAAPDAHIVTYMIHGRMAAGTVAARLPLSTAIESGKRKAVLEYRTQLSLSGKRLLGMVQPEETFTLPSPPHTTLPWQPPVWVRPGLRLLVVSGQGSGSWLWRDAPLEKTRRGWILRDPRLERGGFVKLSLPLRSPWIFDHWGWAELAPPGAGSLA
ncbi:PIG-L family deacetylase [Pinirhizobacter sp.]|jgi:LmbE family N-acetylglucosaminyl deacetylase|uniref:PIG-L deacetylase family protein n=1 Tax=Pinirhizobacter sp. TaxID=2950432 RepID=UPI002F3E317A